MMLIIPFSNGTYFNGDYYLNINNRNNYNIDYEYCFLEVLSMQHELLSVFKLSAYQNGLTVNDINKYLNTFNFKIER